MPKPLADWIAEMLAESRRTRKHWVEMEPDPRVRLAQAYHEARNSLRRYCPCDDWLALAGLEGPERQEQVTREAKRRKYEVN